LVCRSFITDAAVAVGENPLRKKKTAERMRTPRLAFRCLRNQKNSEWRNLMNKSCFSGILKIVAVVVFLCLGMYLLSCSNDTSDQQLIFGLESPPERLVPIKIRSPQTFPVSMQIFEGLFDVNGDGTLIPRIIERWETKDYQTWIFHVRKDVYFHRSPIFKNNIREVTAADVAYSLTRFCAADSYSSFLLMDYLKGARDYNQGKADSVEGLKIVDPYTLKVELEKPVPFFINNISTPVLSVFPKEAEKKEYAEKVGLSMAVGTGPYVFTSMTETEVVLEKNDEYWDKQNKPELDRIIFRVIQNDQTRLASLERGHIDLMVLPTALFNAVFNKDGTLSEHYEDSFTVSPISTFNSHFIGINNKIISDENLRRAMFYGTDRNEMVNSILYGYARVTGGTVPPGTNGYQSPFPKDPFDLEKARDYLKRSLYKGKPIELIVHGLANSEQIGQIFQAQMAKIGITIILKKQDFGSAIGRIIKGDCQLFSMFVEYAWSSPEPILINVFSSSKIPVPNVFKFSNPSVDEMLKRLFGIKDTKESLDYAQKIETRVMEDAPGVFLYRQDNIVIYPKGLTGIEVSRNNHYFLEKVRFKK
jgi:oligopeptide transport system substrate-binding protein